MNPWTRFVRFNTVGAVGMGVQLGSLWFLSEVAHWHYLVATVAALALSVVHNFAWHWHWTWHDRPAAGGPVLAFMRFAGANGMLSLVGNLGVMTTLVSGAHVSPVVANTVAVAVCGLLNYWIGHELVFRPVAPADALLRTPPFAPMVAIRSAGKARRPGMLSMCEGAATPQLAQARWRRAALSLDNARRWESANEAVARPGERRFERPAERPAERQPRRPLRRQPERLGRPPPAGGGSRLAREGL